MFSYKSFTPGANSNSRRLIQYSAYLKPGQSNHCICNSNDDNKVKKDSTNTNGSNISNAQRVSNLIQSQGYGGTVRLGGNSYLGNVVGGQISIINYLGRLEGQSGGSGKPIRNPF
jgi:hypothetical protein